QSRPPLFAAPHPILRLPLSLLPRATNASMITFHVLGALDLRGADGRPLGSPLTGSKRLALLAYLALAGRRRGLTRRDTLLALFWPHLDQSHARNSLSNMLHHIRKALGPDAVVTRGREAIGLTEDYA